MMRQKQTRIPGWNAMTHNPDLVIRGGNIADGPRRRPVSKLMSRSPTAASWKLAGCQAKARKRVDGPAGKLVRARALSTCTTHYDGQVTWSHDITPLVAERRHVSRDGQLRSRLRALPSVRPSAADFN